MIGKNLQEDGPLEDFAHRDITLDQKTKRVYVVGDRTRRYRHDGNAGRAAYGVDLAPVGLLPRAAIFR